MIGNSSLEKVTTLTTASYQTTQKRTPHYALMYNQTQIKPPQPLATTPGDGSQKVEIRNADGDTMSIDIHSIEFQKTLLSGKASLSDADWKKVIEMAKNAYAKQHQALLDSLNGSSTNKQNTAVSSPSENAELSGLPEYWNAENTSVRIVDFALSFFKSSGMDAQEYYESARAAIEKGFKQAVNLMGSMPDPISKLSNDTFALAIKKLDQWAVDQGAVPSSTDEINN